MKIGITERGDAGLDYGWMPKLNEVDGAILITKNITDDFIRHVTLLNSRHYPLIVHATCTGWGGTVIEPMAPEWRKQLRQLKELIDEGFPIERCVLRIDPIFPTNRGLERVCDILDQAFVTGLLPRMRVRISILDEYPHVKKRFQRIGMAPVYGKEFQPSEEMLEKVRKTLSRYDIQFHTCAEPKLVDDNGLFVQSGCVSEIDLRLMGLPVKRTGMNPQNRNGCKCLSGKKELLENKYPCLHGCKYCYWKD